MSYSILRTWCWSRVVGFLAGFFSVVGLVLVVVAVVAIAIAIVVVVEEEEEESTFSPFKSKWDICMKKYK